MFRLILLIFVCRAVFFSTELWGQGSAPYASAGGVTDRSAKIFAWASSESLVLMTYSPDSLKILSGEAPNLRLTAFPDDDFAVTFDLNGRLQPDTKYFYRVTVDGVNGKIQSFKTFPAADFTGYVNFAFGSCQQFRTLPPNEPVFDRIRNVNPRLFIQCGDWGYPDTTDNFPENRNFYSIEYKNVLQSYRARYAGGQMRNLTDVTPLDYVFDDHDFVNDNSSRTSSSIYGRAFTEVPFPPVARRNVIHAYEHLFPHYNLPDTSEGIYHSYRLGNAEIFVCDNRSDRSPNLNSLRDSGGEVYVFDPPAGHSILGAQQMEWLLNGLKTSTAKWKFIVTGVSFNKGYTKVIDAISGNAQLQNFNLPGLDFSPKSIFGTVVDTWAGFPEDRERLLKFLKDNNIPNVIFLTSDSHTSAMDDGQNAGLPEVMAGNLAQTNSRLAWVMQNARTLPIIGNLITTDLSAWNAGGQGLGNNNFNNAFGHIEVFGNDSVRCSLIDERGTLISSMTLCDGGKRCNPTSAEKRLSPQKVLSLYPNPARDAVNVEIPELTDPQAVIWLTDVLGRKIKSEVPKGGKAVFSTADLPAGLYYVLVLTEKGNLVKSFTKQ